MRNRAKRKSNDEAVNCSLPLSYVYARPFCPWFRNEGDISRSTNFLEILWHERKNASPYLFFLPSRRDFRTGISFQGDHRFPRFRGIRWLVVGEEEIERKKKRGERGGGGRQLPPWKSSRKRTPENVFKKANKGEREGVKKREKNNEETASRRICWFSRVEAF